MFKFQNIPCVVESKKNSIIAGIEIIILTFGNRKFKVRYPKNISIYFRTGDKVLLSFKDTYPWPKENETWDLFIETNQTCVTRDFK